MKVLVTGFDPFGGETINPALEAVKRIKDEISGASVIRAEIPTVFRKSIKALLESIDKEKPDIVLCIGQAGGRMDITVERIAINVDDGRIADNEGNQPIDEVIYEDGYPAYFSNLPIKAMVKEINDTGIPASVSNTAGTFVCNHIMYGLMYHINRSYPNIRGGFIHVPYIPSQVAGKRVAPTMALDDIVRGLEMAIKAAVEHQNDIKAIGGTVC